MHTYILHYKHHKFRVIVQHRLKMKFTIGENALIII